MNFSLTPLHQKVLRAVTRYRFLTNSQLHLLRLGHPVSLRKATHYLSRNPVRTPLLLVHKFPVHARFGRVEHVYRLSRAGLSAVSEVTGTEPSTKVMGAGFALDFFHRKAVIDFHIRLDLALSKEAGQIRIERYDQYFEKTGANHRRRSGSPLTARTRIGFRDGSHFIPDVIFQIRVGKKWCALFSLEYVRGNKTARTLRQIAKHRKAIVERAVTKRYAIPKGQDYVSLFLFEDQSLLERVLTRLRAWQPFKALTGHFLFATAADTKRDVRSCWRKVGDDHFLYDFITGKRKYRLTYAGTGT